MNLSSAHTKPRVRQPALLAQALADPQSWATGNLDCGRRHTRAVWRGGGGGVVLTPPVPRGPTASRCQRFSWELVKSLYLKDFFWILVQTESFHILKRVKSAHLWSVLQPKCRNTTVRMFYERAKMRGQLGQTDLHGTS